MNISVLWKSYYIHAAPLQLMAEIIVSIFCSLVQPCPPTVYTIVYELLT